MRGRFRGRFRHACTPSIFAVNHNVLTTSPKTKRDRGLTNSRPSCTSFPAITVLSSSMMKHEPERIGPVYLPVLLSCKGILT
jgi:hypothetical protein